MIKELRKEQEYFLVNEHDPDLMTFKVKTPDLVEWYSKFLGYTPTWEEAVKLVDGYDLPIQDQKFRVVEYPERLKEIIKIIRRNKGLKRNKTITVDEIYDELDRNRSYYKNEIDFIKRDIKRRYHGYWFMNNGQPTFIDGWHYVYLNYWDIKNNSNPLGLPEYRDIDRRLFLFARYCYTTTEAWFPYKVSFRNKLGEIDFKYFSRVVEAQEFQATKKNSLLEGGKGHEGFIADFKRRTVYGFAHPKRRRRGATSAVTCIAYLIGTEGKKRNVGLQSLNETLALTDVFSDKLVRPWKKIPFYLKPVHDGTSTPKTKINFQYPADRSAMGAEAKIDSHDGWIEPRSATERAFDGTMLHAIVRDEGGKIDGFAYDLNEWWNIHKKCLAQGGGRIIHGLGMIPSTVGEMDSGGGLQYERFLLSSKYEERNQNGQTQTGCLVYMEPAFDGLDGFIDPYGMSIIDDPEYPVLNSTGETINIGARSYLVNQRAGFEAKNDHAGLISEMRDHPFTLREATSKSTRDSGFNISILRKRRQELAYGLKRMTRRVNLEWVVDFGGEVRVVDDPEGKFIISRRPDDAVANKMEWDTDLGHWQPALATCNKFIIGADPFAFNEENVSGQIKSDGGIAVFYNRDTAIDTDDKPKEEWISNKFVCTYSHRSDDKNVYAEDVLKLCIYYSCFVFPEMNVPLVSEKFIEWNFRGYLLYDTDEYGVPNKSAGRKTTPAVKDQIFADTMTYIQNFGAYENHIEILDQWININDPSEMTMYDLFTACGYCFLGRASKFPTTLAESARPVEFKNGEVFEEF